LERVFSKNRDSTEQIFGKNGDSTKQIFGKSGDSTENFFGKTVIRQIFIAPIYSVVISIPLLKGKNNF